MAGTASSESLVVQFCADKKAHQAHELDLRQKEMTCMQIKWCTEAGYSDNNVTEEKVLRFWTCLTASEGDPDNGIIILPGMRGKRTGAGQDGGGRISDIGGNDSDENDSDSDSNGSDENDKCSENNLPAFDAPSLSMVKLHASALGELYRQQRTDPDNKVMYKSHERKPMDYLRDLIASYERRMVVTKRATDTDQGSVNFVEEDPLASVKM
ncbi:hypothetical protein BGZ59_003892, partial [Podila verticillata]